MQATTTILDVAEMTAEAIEATVATVAEDIYRLNAFGEATKVVVLKAGSRVPVAALARSAARGTIGSRIPVSSLEAVTPPQPPAVANPVRRPKVVDGRPTQRIQVHLGLVRRLFSIFF